MIEVHDLFDPPFTTLNVGTIEGGSAKNIIPGHAELLVEWRPIPGASPGRIPTALQEMLQHLEAQYKGLRASLTLLRQEAGFETASDSDLVSAFEKEIGLPATSIPFGSEASAWSTVAEDVVVFGPGDMRTAHSDRECVPIDQLITTVQVLRAMMQGTEDHRIDR
jgi:acetylornithine deacetylase